ncbi:hypothetical protein ACFSRY_05400 [Pontibacter locisalis]|uniref:Outer membrane protein beta-barrel domain-containing protein n=1 Tax=Pontibacter locisalis TaxID=1719035 RepID=A0ABW5IJ43_9BACT
MNNKFILPTLLALLLNFSTHLVIAQGQVATRLIRGSNFQIGVGYEYQRMDFENLNSSLTSSGFPELSESVHSVSFLTQNISDNWVIGLRTTYAITNEVKFDRKEINYRNNKYSLELAYNLLSSDKAVLLPSVAATLGRNVLLIKDMDATQQNFQNLLQNPSQEADLRNYSYLADLGLAYHYQFYRREHNRETGKSSSWIPVIFKAGYLLELGSSDFKFNGEEIAGVPEVSLGGFYASIHIGLGTRLLPLN